MYSPPYNALSFSKQISMKKLADSPTITITVNPIQTFIVNFDINPKSGNAPFAITFTGNLSNNSGAVGNTTLLNGETIYLQQNIAGVWQNVASATTASVSGVPGVFSGTYTIPANTAPGTYDFRTHYGGNSTKGLFGCIGNLLQTQVQQAQTPPTTPAGPLAAVVAIGAPLLIVGALLS